jgi:DNA polymerase type B, organellar and viral
LQTGLIAPDVFERIKINKEKRGSFHNEPIGKVKLYTSDELHALCVFMHMMRDAYWNALGIKLKSFHSPANAAGELLKRIGIRDRKTKGGDIIRGHSWPVKSVNLEHEQIIAHWAYYGGRFECMYKGFFKNTTFNYDLASAYPYAMQSLLSMRGGRWEREQPRRVEIFRDLCHQGKSIMMFGGREYKAALTFPERLQLIPRRVDILKRIETCSILSIFKVKFDFKIVAPFYPLPYRTRSGSILFPRKGYGYYMRDHVLADRRGKRA